MRRAPNLFSIPAGVPFLPTLADALLAGRLGLDPDPAAARDTDPLALARLTLFLPTRRAAQAFSRILGERLGGPAALLPRIVPLGDVEEAETQGILGDLPGAAELPPAIDLLERRLLLALQIRAVNDALDRAALKLGEADGRLTAGSFAAAFALAGDLAALLDQLQTEAIPFERLKTLDATRFDRLWAVTAEFLAIAGESWPRILAERGLSDPAARLDAVLRAEADRLAAGTHDPVIAAGSTGSVPATARLLGAIARLPNGAVVLPDLDRDLDEASWQAVLAPDGTEGAASHPQAQLARLLQRLEARREDVVELAVPDGPAAARRALAREALRPAGTTDRWSDLPDRLGGMRGEAADGLAVIEAADERREAIAVALAIREALQEPGATVALVTADRGLAERVAVDLARWDIAVRDSAGRPLGRTQAGALVALVADVVRSEGGAAALIALLDHADVRLGLARAEVVRARQVLDIAAFRGVRVEPGMAGLRAALAAAGARRAEPHAPRPRRRLGDAEIAAMSEVAERLLQALAPLMTLPAEPPLGRVAEALRATVAALVAAGEAEPGSGFAERADADALDAVLTGLAAADPPGFGRPILAALDSHLETVWLALGDATVRETAGGHPRVRLLGLLEARLLAADLTILSGLNEESWPPAVATDAFLNRPMRAELGLSPPERRIGQSAHDFVQGFAHGRVVLSRAARAGGTPTLPSRFWARIRAVMPAEAWAGALARGARYGEIARALDDPAGPPRPVTRPRPTPPAILQPGHYSATEVETLFRDPYQIYARKILGLDELEPLDPALDGRDRGELLHAILERFVRETGPGWPADAETRLARIAEEVFAPLRGMEDVDGFWWPRWLKLAPDVLAWDSARRERAAAIGVELRAALKLPLPDGGEIGLSARADRVERLASGGLAILDYKTGLPPTPAQVKARLAPQLPLEAALAARTAFAAPPGAPEAAHLAAEIGPGEVEEAALVHLRPGAFAETSPIPKDETLQAMAEASLAGFLKVVAELRAGARPWLPRFAPYRETVEGPYDPLSRYKEWSAAGDEGDDGGDEGDGA